MGESHGSQEDLRTKGKTSHPMHFRGTTSPPFYLEQKVLSTFLFCSSACKLHVQDLTVSKHSSKCMQFVN